MAKFKCNTTGQEYEFTMDHDIRDMRRHPEYTEVVEEVKKEEPKAPAAKKVTKED